MQWWHTGKDDGLYSMSRRCAATNDDTGNGDGQYEHDK
jgi:hypothetical protein